jgi:hypothetical protein
VVSVYTADGSSLLATGDDSTPRYSTDTEMFFRATETGDVCLKVEEWSTWTEADEALTDPTWKYTLYAWTMDLVNGPNPESEPNDNLEQAQDVEFYTPTTSNNTYAFLYGVFDSPSDTECFSYTLPASNVAAHVYFMPAGPGSSGTDWSEGYGSTAELGMVELTDSSGNVIASLDASLGSDALSVPLPVDSEVVLWFNMPTSASAGANDYYVFRHFNSETDNPAEEEVAGGANDTMATAETITIASDDRGYIMGYIDPVDDVDYYGFNVGISDTLTIACGAARSGSGLDGARFAIHDDSDNELQAEVESDDGDIWWADHDDASMDALSVSSNQQLYLRVSASGQDPDVSSNFYRCGVYPSIAD